MFGFYTAPSHSSIALLALLAVAVSEFGLVAGEGEDSLTTRSPKQADTPEEGSSACLCVFDIDRTLTGKQSDTTHCPDNKELEMYDGGYGGGNLTLSALSVAGLATTFCNQCYLGITSAGIGSGEGSEWNDYLLDKVMVGDVQDTFTSLYPDSKRWSYGTNVTSPYVLGQPDTLKQDAVLLVREWYGAAPRNISIEAGSVYFFGDRTENILPFGPLGMNSREVSCVSRDYDIFPATGMIGYCGASPKDIQRSVGNVCCQPAIVLP